MGARRFLALAALVLAAQAVSGCAVAHRYPAYKGQVLELGTDQPIEGAGVLARYKTKHPSPGGDVTSYLGYQGLLTDAEGRFEIRAKWFVPLWPFSWFDDEVRITIFKYGYGNFPGSYSRYKPKIGESPYALRVYVETEPELERNLLPSEQEVTFWLPKLEGREEIIQHSDRLPLDLRVRRAGFPPKGMTAENFGYGSAVQEEK